MTVELIKGKWHVNGKLYKDLTPNEIIILDKFIQDYKNGF